MREVHNINLTNSQSLVREKPEHPPGVTLRLLWQLIPEGRVCGLVTGRFFPDNECPPLSPVYQVLDKRSLYKPVASVSSEGYSLLATRYHQPLCCQQVCATCALLGDVASIHVSTSVIALNLNTIVDSTSSNQISWVKNQ